MQVPSSAHILFIPGILILGFVFGFLVGGKAARDAAVQKQRREEEREAARAKRAARKAKKDALGASSESGDSDD